ncbi:rCG21503 [Rattus norvegicus]|uniref:RCG21503 n=1 Tax=Rattus norvegicus TaxID=10116 RepID=A6J0L3_RAT|nr:rCG21503 [Rattus norvegicus]
MVNLAQSKVSERRDSNKELSTSDGHVCRGLS